MPDTDSQHQATNGQANASQEIDLYEPPRSGYPRLRGWQRRALFLELARGGKSAAQLGEEFGGRAPETIRWYHAKYRAEIDAIRADLEAEFAGLWIAEKAARLAEYESDVDAINAVQEDSGELDAALLRVKATALRNAAEEMGHLPNRPAGVAVEGQRVTVTIEGIDPAALT